MAWTPPKTWNYQDPLSFEDLNTYVRDNTDFLYHGLQFVVGQWSREQTAQVSLTANTWNLVDSGGLTKISVGGMLAGDFLELGANARATGTSLTQWNVGISIYESTTHLKRYVGAKAATGESMGMPAIFSPTTAYADIQVYLTIWCNNGSSSDVLPLASAPEVWSWFYAVHKRPPTI